MRGPDHELYLSFAYPCQPPMGRELVGRASKQRVDGMGMQGVGRRLSGRCTDPKMGLRLRKYKWKWPGCKLERRASPNEMILPPRVLDDLDAFSTILSADRVGLFSDFDGTLTPLFDDPRNTVLSPAIRDTLSQMSEKLELVAVVSGREARVLRKMIHLKNVTYIGNHGLEEWEAGGEQPKYEVQVSDGFVEEIEKGVGGIGVSGLSMENKSLSVAVHYRNAQDPTSARSALSQMLKPLAAAHDLEIREGKMVMEIGPGTGVNKGTAVGGLAREYELTGAIVLGDDVTDCDAFDALHGLVREGGLMGAAVAVVDEETPEPVLRKADYRLSGSEEVEKFLCWMAYASPRAEMKL